MHSHVVKQITLVFCMTLFASWASAISPSSGDVLIFTKKNGKEIVFHTGEPVHCFTRQTPRQLVHGTIDTITANYIIICGEMVLLQDLEMLGQQGTSFDKTTNILLIGSLAGSLLVSLVLGIRKLANFGTNMMVGGSGILVFTLIVFMGSLFAKIIRRLFHKRVRRISKKYKVRVDRRH